MTIVSFLADAAVTETVAGLGVGSSPEEVRGVLGTECGADSKKKSLRLDYGLLEFGFYAGLCEGIYIQVHRLVTGREELVPGALRIAASGMSRTVSLDALRSEVERRGEYPLDELRPQTGYRLYRVVGSAVDLIVNDEPASDNQMLAVGDLWSLQISAGN